MQTLFSNIPQFGVHPLARVYMAYGRDQNPSKADLGIGVYRDENGESPIMKSVQLAEMQLLETRKSKDYLAPDGNRRYSSLIERLLLGEDHPALLEDRVRSIQTPGGGGALRAAAELIRTISPDATVWVSQPTWDHQIFVLKMAGVRVAEYPYYDRQANRLEFDRMCAALRHARAGDVVLLHGCCHNPTGEDLTPDQWQSLSEIFLKQNLIPYIDIAYLGFGGGLDADVIGTRMMAARQPETIIASSSSKSFGVYRDRAGALTVIGSEAGQLMNNISRQIFDIGCGLYFMPPDGGAATVAQVLDNAELRALWRRELDDMRSRIDGLRRQFRDALEAASAMDFGFIGRQKGMFSLLPLDSEAMLQLETTSSIYMMPEGRINIAALSSGRIAPVARAIAAVL